MSLVAARPAPVAALVPSLAAPLHTTPAHSQRPRTPPLRASNARRSTHCTWGPHSRFCGAVASHAGCSQTVAAVASAPHGVGRVTLAAAAIEPPPLSGCT